MGFYPLPASVSLTSSQSRIVSYFGCNVENINFQTLFSKHRLCSPHPLLSLVLICRVFPLFGFLLLNPHQANSPRPSRAPPQCHAASQKRRNKSQTALSSKKKKKSSWKTVKHIYPVKNEEPRVLQLKSSSSNVSVSPDGVAQCCCLRICRDVPAEAGNDSCKGWTLGAQASFSVRLGCPRRASRCVVPVTPLGRGRICPFAMTFPMAEV